MGVFVLIAHGAISSRSPVVWNLSYSFLEYLLSPSSYPVRSRWGPVPVLHASAAWLWHHGEAHQAAGQLLPGGDPQDGRLPLRGGHQA